jgi:hypothetical protein
MRPVVRTNLSTRNKYIDLDLEDCVLPLYFSKRLTQAIESNQLPNMVFNGSLWEPKSIVANSVAKKINATITALVFNEEPRSRNLKKGERTLTVLRLLLKKHATANEKKLFIIEDLDQFPKGRLRELFDIINNEKFHHFVFFSASKAMQPFIKFYPQIAFDFKINHSAEEEEAYWQQCQHLVSKHKKMVGLNELKLIIKSTYFFWVSLLGRETLQSLRKELEFIFLNPEKPVKPAQILPLPLRMSPIQTR